MAPAIRLVEVALQHPSGIDRDELGHAVGLEPSAGTFGSYLSRARTLLDVDSRTITPSAALF